MTLSCVQRPPSSNDERIVVCSGFLVSIMDVWFYVTAGHILREINSALNAGSRFDIWRLGDQTAGNRFNDSAIPFDFVLDRWLVIENEDIGLDYAAVALDAMYCRQLAAGGAEPIEEHAWGDYVTESDQWLLVGIPFETVKYDGETIIAAKVVLIPLMPESVPEMAGRKSENQFYARLDKSSENFVTDIAGMSGAPIFSLKKVSDEWKYCVIGVQSGWYKSSRTITACPFSSFGNAVAAQVAACIKGVENGAA